MALDISLFTLTFQRRSNDPTILDLLPFHPAATPSSLPSPLYSFSRAQTVSDYDVQLVDHLTSIPLSSISATSSLDKSQRIQLYNPSETIVLEKKNMTFRQDWRWTWQKQEYSARRDGRAYIVEAVRKPDPEIDVARYAPATKTRPAFLQILDYNIQRLEVDDRRGLEVLILTAICTLLDAEYDEKYKDGPSGNIYMTGGPSNSISSSSQGGGGTGNGATLQSNQQAPIINTPTIRPEQQQISGEANEIFIDMHTPIDVYVQHAIRLMRQDQDGESLHLIILKATSPQLTPKAVRIAAEIKAKWYRLEAVAKGSTLDPLPGSTSEVAEELYQYVRDPTLQKTTPTSPGLKPNDNSGIGGGGPRPRIKLDAPTSPSGRSPSPNTAGHASSNNKTQKAYAPPPAQLDIYLSKERIDEFEVGLSTSGNGKSARSSFDNRTSAKTPVIPPKGTPFQIPPKANQSQSKHESHPSDGSSSGAKKILGKLGLRKNHASEA